MISVVRLIFSQNRRTLVLLYQIKRILVPNILVCCLITKSRIDTKNKKGNVRLKSSNSMSRDSSVPDSMYVTDSFLFGSATRKASSNKVSKGQPDALPVVLGRNAQHYSLASQTELSDAENSSAGQLGPADQEGQALQTDLVPESDQTSQTGQQDADLSRKYQNRDSDTVSTERKSGLTGNNRNFNTNSKKTASKRTLSIKDSEERSSRVRRRSIRQLRRAVRYKYPDSAIMNHHDLIQAKLRRSRDAKNAKQEVAISSFSFFSSYEGNGKYQFPSVIQSKNKLAQCKHCRLFIGSEEHPYSMYYPCIRELFP